MIRLSATLSLLILFCANLAAQNVLYDTTYNPKTGSRLRLITMTELVPGNGYMAVRVEARNGEKVPVAWTFDFTSCDQSWAQDASELTSNFKVSCPPGEARNVELMVPLTTSFRTFETPALKVRIAASAPLKNGQAEMSGIESSGWPAILISETLAIPNLGPLESHLKRTGAAGKRSYGGGRREDFGSTITPESLSTDWRAYTGFEVLMLTTTDWADVPAGAKNAILKWTRLGGHLIIYAATTSTDLVTLGIDPGESRTSPGDRSWGKVEILPTSNSQVLDPATTVDTIRKGQELEPLSTLMREGFSSRWPLQVAFGTQSFNAVFFIIILIVFAIIVGPVNIFVFAKATQRHRLFITTPIISIAASLLLLVVILLQDGFGGKGQRLALVEVRPEENTLYIQQQQIARTGVLLGTSFEMPDHATISPLALDPSRWARITMDNNGGQSRYRIQDAEKNQLKYSGDWFKSRSEYGHLITAVKSSRGRLELLSPNGQPTVTSTFDFPLEKIYYLDSNNGYWTNAKPLSSGRKAQLVSANGSDFDRWLAGYKDQLTSDGKTRLDLAREGRNRFFATASQGPFIETLSSLNWTKSTALVMGPVAIP